jgi:hypothetical protein
MYLCFLSFRRIQIHPCTGHRQQRMSSSMCTHGFPIPGPKDLTCPYRPHKIGAFICQVMRAFLASVGIFISSGHVTKSCCVAAGSFTQSVVLTCFLSSYLGGSLIPSPRCSVTITGLAKVPHWHVLVRATQSRKDLAHYRPASLVSQTSATGSTISML